MQKEANKSSKEGGKQDVQNKTEGTFWEEKTPQGPPKNKQRPRPPQHQQGEEEMNMEQEVEDKNG